MILTKTEPFTKDEIVKLCEEFETNIKTVIDVERKVCSAGMNRHFEGEILLLDARSSQSDIWGGGIDIETIEIDFNSFINIRPRDNNRGERIENLEVQDVYRTLTEFFFKEIV